MLDLDSARGDGGAGSVAKNTQESSQLLLRASSEVRQGQAGPAEEIHTHPLRVAYSLICKMFWGARVTLIVQEFLESIGKQVIPSTGSCLKTPQGAARWSLGRLNHTSRGAEAG